MLLFIKIVDIINPDILTKYKLTKLFHLNYDIALLLGAIVLIGMKYEL